MEEMHHWKINSLLSIASVLEICFRRPYDFIDSRHSNNAVTARKLLKFLQENFV